MLDTYKPPITSIAENIAYDYGYKEGIQDRDRIWESKHGHLEDELIRQYIGEKKWLVTDKTESIAAIAIDRAVTIGHRHGQRQREYESERKQMKILEL